MKGIDFNQIDSTLKYKSKEGLDFNQIDSI